MYDLIISGGTIVDGSGKTRFTGDIAISGEKIVAVGNVDGEAKNTIDATGLLVTPGWVDVHTHYDGQATWDPVLAPSSWHGVTTVVMGNCGVGFAPVRPGDQQYLIEHRPELVDHRPNLIVHRRHLSSIDEIWTTDTRHNDPCRCSK